MQNYIRIQRHISSRGILALEETSRVMWYYLINLILECSLLYSWQISTRCLISLVLPTISCLLDLLRTLLENTNKAPGFGVSLASPRILHTMEGLGSLSSSAKLTMALMSYCVSISSSAGAGGWHSYLVLTVLSQTLMFPKVCFLQQYLEQAVSDFPKHTFSALCFWVYLIWCEWVNCMYMLGDF